MYLHNLRDYLTEAKHYTLQYKCYPLRYVIVLLHSLNKDTVFLLCTTLCLQTELMIRDSSTSIVYPFRTMHYACSRNNATEFYYECRLSHPYQICYMYET